MKKNNFPRMHVSYYVSDIQQSVKFYDTFFNVPATKVKQGYAKYVLESPSLIISFIENKEKVKHQFGHLGFQLETTEELTNSLNRIQAAGLKVKEEMGTNCCYAKQDKFWVSDPDGYQWELYYFHEDVEFNDPHFSHQSQEACCSPTLKTATAEACCTPEQKQKARLQLSELHASEKCC